MLVAWCYLRKQVAWLAYGRTAAGLLTLLLSLQLQQGQTVLPLRRLACCKMCP